MQLASQSYPADLLGVVTLVSSREDREFTKSKEGKNGLRAAQKGKVTCDEHARRCSTRECPDAKLGCGQRVRIPISWNRLRASQLCWRLNRARADRLGLASRVSVAGPSSVAASRRV